MDKEVEQSSETFNQTMEILVASRHSERWHRAAWENAVSTFPKKRGNPESPIKSPTMIVVSNLSTAVTYDRPSLRA